MIKTLNDISVSGKKVIVRVDLNVPLKDGVITSIKRIQAVVPTIKKLVSENAKVILLSHLGRVKTQDDLPKRDLTPVAVELANQLNQTITFVKATRGEIVEKTINEMGFGEVVLLQNTRYEDLNNKAESKNDQELAKYWASLADVYVNDAFGTSHRAHASNVGISSYIKESAIGYLVEKEMLAMHKAMDNPEHPYVAIVGGAKVSDKIQVLENLTKIADKMIIGGGMAYTFKKAQGYSVGDSLVEDDFIGLAKDFLNKYSDKVVLPLDHLCTREFADVEPVIQGYGIEEGFMGMDIGPKSIELFKEVLQGAKTVVWNGPVGVTEFEHFKTGTLEVCKMIASLENVYSVVGGGDSVAAVQKLGMEDKFSHVSTGGGAILEMLQGRKLPGIEAIQKKTY
ncbi:MULTISPECIES: phosphoglycerate kinase [unclassified Mycoplasma]|uniref:phosphoglycerate kinase n=1 Tax=unclassified Mycoplasma TaxID=2683645 RepID=UPI00211CE133|nr:MULTISPECIES: phosphoglycerate kinase [unclassified Mycoplasma]UUM20103.1 phosphoglycerate kinase [Mycoplasma sp. 1578d]UUM25083.1 phosphoglycerate kinase [Mycoplasma sp. 3686d]